MTLQRDTDEDVVAVMASTIPPGMYGEPTTTTAEPVFEETNANDYRLTLFIASSSFIILTLISIISFVSCFILCNEGKDMNVAQRSLIHSMSSSSALNLMAATTTHNQLNQINSLDHNYYERELNDPLDDHLQGEEEQEEDADDTGDYGAPGMQGYRVTLEDYFPSPTRIMHEIQFQLLLQHQQQNHQQKTSNHPPDLQPKPPQPPLHQQPIVQPIMIQSGDQQTQQLTQQKQQQMPCRVAPPRPPRQKHKKSTEDVEKGNHVNHVSKPLKPCVCKVKTQVETKSVGCGTDHVLLPRTKSKTKEENNTSTTVSKQYL